MRQAITEALESTLVNDVNNIFNAKRVAFVIYYSHEDELRISEMDDIHDFMSQFKTEYEVKWGHGYDDSLGHKIKITILVTGFGLEDILTKTEQQELVTEEQLREMAEKEEAERKRRAGRRALMGRYYGEYIDSASECRNRCICRRRMDDDSSDLFAWKTNLPTSGLPKTCSRYAGRVRNRYVPKACRSPRLPLTKTRSLNLAAQLLVLGNE